MQEIWDEALYPLPSDSPCRTCLCGRCRPDYYKKCTVWLGWFAKRWNEIQLATVKAAKI